MGKIKDLCITIIIMSVVSVSALLLLSMVTYTFKWQADMALLGITSIYILAGYCGGVSFKYLGLRRDNKIEEGVWVQPEQVSMGRRMLEGIGIGSLYMLLLIIVSLGILHHAWVVESRICMIWMLLAGSAALGRIL